MSADVELDELERYETLVRGQGWVPDVDKGADYEEWTGKWYTPTRPDGTGGCSLALYADDEELLYAKYIAALRNAAPRLIRAARHLASLDKAGVVAENEALRQLLCETKRQRDEQRERAEAGKETVAAALDLADKYNEKRAELRKALGARWNESVEDAAQRLARRPSESPHCDSCSCGMVQLEWSDRAPLVRLSDYVDVAYAIISCALDHSYDRTPSGVPYGLPSAVETACIPIVDRHLSAVRADWGEHTVNMDDAQRSAFKDELVAALKAASDAEDRAARDRTAPG